MSKPYRERERERERESSRNKPNSRRGNAQSFAYPLYLNRNLTDIRLRSVSDSCKRPDNIESQQRDISVIVGR